MTDLAEASPVTDGADRALLDLLGELSVRDYAFITPTPGTHAYVAGRLARSRPGSLRDALGWCRPFALADLPENVGEALRTAGVLSPCGDLVRSTIRVASLGERLHLHSAPGSDRDAVFLGPDSYRFVRFLEGILGDAAFTGRALDIGVGAGAGALAIAARSPSAEVIGLDVNPKALRLLAVNAAHSGAAVRGVLGNGLHAVDGGFDLIIANPPYIAGSGGRTYRDGGGDRGAALGLDWARQSIPRLNPGGRLVMYTGSPIVEGQDAVQSRLEALAAASGLGFSYEEIDPDVFGGTLAGPAYRDVERIAAVGAVLQKPVAGET